MSTTFDDSVTVNNTLDVAAGGTQSASFTAVGDFEQRDLNHREHRQGWREG